MSSFQPSKRQLHKNQTPLFHHNACLCPAATFIVLFLKPFYAEKKSYQTSLTCPVRPPGITTLCSTLTPPPLKSERTKTITAVHPRVPYISIFYELCNYAHLFLDLSCRYGFVYRSRFLAEQAIFVTSQSLCKCVLA